jgi:uncharacterized protein
MSAAAAATSSLVPPEKRPLLEEICRRYGVTWLAVFGSVARGDARHDSDVDVLYELEPGRIFTYFQLFDLAEDLRPVFGRAVDLGRPKQIHWYIRPRVLAEAIEIYAR